MYVKQKVLKNGAVCWECDQRRNKFACKAKLPVLVMKVTNDHTHARTSTSTLSGQQPENQKHHPRLPQE